MSWPVPTEEVALRGRVGARALTLAQRAAFLGRLGRAERLARHAHSQLRQAGEDLRRSTLLLGELALATGRYADAGPLFHGALASSEKGRAADDLDIEALVWLGLSAFLQGDRSLAETRLAAACRWVARADSPPSLAARCRGYLGWILSQGTEGSEGIRLLDESVQALLRCRHRDDAVAFDALCAAAEARDRSTSQAQRRLSSAWVTGSPANASLLELAEVTIDQHEAERASEHADHVRADRLLQQARARAEAALARVHPMRPERHVQQRLLLAAVGDLRTRRVPDPAKGPVVEVAVDGAWFRTLDDATVGCERRPVLRRLLVELARQRIERPGRPIPGSELFAAGWPDQRISTSSAKNRLKVAISTLRKMGFGPAIVGDRSGYRIDPRVPIRLIDPAN